jgi:hypothetical protein
MFGVRMDSRTTKAAAALVAALLMTLGLAAPAMALPEANVSMNSPSTFKLGSKKVIYPKVKIYVASSFGDANEADMLYGNVVVYKAGASKTYVNRGLARVLTNRTLTFEMSAVSQPGKYYLMIRNGQIREDAKDCGTSTDCTKKVATVSKRKFYFTVKK